MSNRVVRLARRPRGTVPRDDFTIEDRPLPEPEAGEFRLRTALISLDPAMRGWMVDSRSYVPPVGIGEVLRAHAADYVDKSNNASSQVGDAVVGLLGVQQHAISHGRRDSKVDTKLAPLQRWIGGLGMPGWTAYFDRLEVGQPKARETVLVSTASGANGSDVGPIAQIAQIAKIANIKGCRTVGIAGGQDECRSVTQELGFDDCVD